MVTVEINKSLNNIKDIKELENNVKEFDVETYNDKYALTIRITDNSLADVFQCFVGKKILFSIIDD